MTQNDSARSVASRLFLVLAAFRRGGPRMTLTELSLSTGLPMTTTFRLAHDLLREGALERNDDGTFQVGLRLWELGSLTPRPRELRSVARPHMVGLHEATGETVQLAVVEGHRAFCVEKVAGSRSVANVTEVARGLPLHATAVGKTILAFDPGARRRIDGRALSRFTYATITDGAALDVELARARGELAAYSREEFTVGTASVAVPVFDAAGGFVAALGVLTASPLSLRRLVGPVRAAADAISRRLGAFAADRPAVSG